MKGTIKYDRLGNATYFLDGSPATKAEYDAAFPDKPLGAPEVHGGWPLVSEALAVHPNQVEAANARNKRNGVNARYAPDGSCHIPDRADRKRLLKLEGFHDRSGGYGD